MNDQERKERIVTIKKEVFLLNEERELLQQGCKHSKYRIGIYSWRIACFDEKRICNICDEIMGNPTDEERDQFTNEKNEGQGLKEYDNNDIEITYL